jgi:hypothetical protein
MRKWCAIERLDEEATEVLVTALRYADEQTLSKQRKATKGK